MTELDVSNMTPEQRLKQIEIILSTLAKNQVKHESRMSELELGQISLQAEIESVTRLLGETIATMSRSQAEVERIWRYLQSRSGNGNSPQ